MNKLQQLIRESVNEYMKAIEEAGEMAGHKSKMEAAKEAIEKRDITKTLNKLEEEEKMMIDDKKVKEMANEKKALEKYLAKLQKQLDKLESKADKTPKVEEEKEIVDEVAIDLEENEDKTLFKVGQSINYPEGGKAEIIKISSYDENKEEIDKSISEGGWESNTPREELTWYKIEPDEYGNIEWFDEEELKEYNSNEKEVGGYDVDGDPNEDGEYNADGSPYNKNEINESFLHMQKLAGIISESEYKVKVEEAAKKKASAGLTKKEKSSVVKKARAGKDIGKKGKDFEDVAKSAGGGEKGKKIAAAAMWKGEAKKAKNLKEEVLALFEND